MRREIFCVMVAFSLFLIGCGEQRFCPDDATPMPDAANRSIYVLIDNSDTYAYRQNAIDLLSTFFTQNDYITANDQIAISMMGKGNPERLVTFGLELRESNFPASTEAPASVPDQLQGQNTVTETDSVKEHSSNDAIATKIATREVGFEYACKVIDYNNAPYWKLSENDIGQIKSDLESGFSEISETEQETDIFASVYASADFLQRPNDHNYILIFSDMVHNAESTVDTTYVQDLDLTGVSVIVALVPYEVDLLGIDLEQYVEMKAQWQTWFEQKDVADVQFLDVDNTNTVALNLALEPTQGGQ